MADVNELYGSCSCERNKYTVIIPTDSTSLAHVFFDNSVENRRSQATPVTAWLRVPLDWFSSTTHAQFDDETHPLIRRTYHTPSTHSTQPRTRRQFCGYCGTHLTAWNEGHRQEQDFLDITLGSLLSESVRMLEALDIMEAGTDEGTNDGDDEHRVAGEETMDESAGAAPRAVSHRTTGTMRYAGMPYFEEMVENSELGQIKRRKGGHTSMDGKTTVEWEITEIDGDVPAPTSTTHEATTDTGSSKRQKLDT